MSLPDCITKIDLAGFAHAARQPRRYLEVIVHGELGTRRVWLTRDEAAACCSLGCRLTILQETDEAPHA